MRRRRFLGLATSVVVAGACDDSDPGAGMPEAFPNEGVLFRFSHGIASGDPLADRVVLWTRVSVHEDDEPEVEWLVARDPDLLDVVARGAVTTTSARDHTVKVDVGGLSPGTTYWYAFELDGVRSAVGRTRTLAAGASEYARLAVVSCANYPVGFFNVYAALALRDDLDAVVHLGDYIYEYADGDYGTGATLGRTPEPAHECLTLADYRLRHASYKRDPDLQEAHRLHPFIVAWDDHEIANNAWTGDAGNHQDDEGDWDARKAAAVQAYREWMPLREPTSPDEPATRRSFRFGDLLDLVLVDTRLTGRDRQVAADDEEGLADPSRSMLGDAQERWLFDTLARSHDDGVAWRVLGQQVRMGQLFDEDGLATNTDSWDGYPAARDRLLAHVETRGIRDLVVLTGDMHSSWAFELRRDPFADSAALAVELITPAVSSPVSKSPPALADLTARHPHLRWAEFAHRGYIALELTQTHALATWHLVKDVKTPHAEVPAAKAFAIARGEAKLVDLAT